MSIFNTIRHIFRPKPEGSYTLPITGNLPPRRSAWEGELAGDVHARAFADQLERVKPAPRVPEWERIATEMRVVAEHVVRGVMPAARAPEELDARVDRLLEKRRWMLARGPA